MTCFLGSIMEKSSLSKSSLCPFITQKHLIRNTVMNETKLLRVAALVDLPRTRLSGGHLKSWERLARAAANSRLPLDLTLYCSGPALTEELAWNVRIRQLPPVYSTSRLKFLPYLPDNTDLGSFHQYLAQEIINADVIHTTDGYFCFARTAEKVGRKKKIPIVTSFHTNTPAYARVFTTTALEKMFGHGKKLHFLTDVLKIPQKQENKKLARMKKHLAFCAKVLYTRQEDKDLAEPIVGPQNLYPIRLGVDRTMIGPHRADRAGVEVDYKVPAGRIIFLFVGRLDIGKNIYTLIEAMEKLIAEGQPVHLITAGLGPAESDLHMRLAGHVTVAGFVDPDELARLYASVDALALTSEIEIRSMAAVESVTSGLPVLVSEKSGVAELFDNTPAMMVISGGAEEWAHAMREFCSSINKRTHMRKVALSYAETHIANWVDVLAEDLLPQWQKAYYEKKENG